VKGTDLGARKKNVRLCARAAVKSRGSRKKEKSFHNGTGPANEIGHTPLSCRKKKVGRKLSRGISLIFLTLEMSTRAD